MENQHRESKGYRELSKEEIGIMNLVKGQGEALERLIAGIALTRAIAKPTFF